jgi:hypothetical protein
MRRRRTFRLGWSRPAPSRGDPLKRSGWPRRELHPAGIHAAPARAYRMRAACAAFPAAREFLHAIERHIEPDLDRDRRERQRAIMPTCGIAAVEPRPISHALAHEVAKGRDRSSRVVRSRSRRIVLRSPTPHEPIKAWRAEGVESITPCATGGRLRSAPPRDRQGQGSWRGTREEEAL